MLILTTNFKAHEIIPFPIAEETEAQPSEVIRAQRHTPGKRRTVSKPRCADFKSPVVSTPRPTMPSLC